MIYLLALKRLARLSLLLLAVNLSQPHSFCWRLSCFSHETGTAVGIIPCGKGKIIFSTLDICNNLNSKESTANAARKLLCTFIEYDRTYKK